MVNCFSILTCLSAVDGTILMVALSAEKVLCADEVSIDVGVLETKIAAGQYIGVDPLLSKSVVRPVLARVLPPSIPGHESPPASGTERGSLCEALHVVSSRSDRGGG
eukprot:scaffold7302_cov72-Cyclotella_meneghiniana.AAC.1